MECLFGWDKKKQQGRPGILGTLEAFCEAIEEQGRGTLHGHFLIWVKNFALLRRMLHDKRKAARESAKKEYIKYIDQVVSVRHGDFCLDVEHECKSGSPDSIYKNRESETNDSQAAKHQPLRDARHNVKCRDIDGMVMQCKTCGAKERPTDVITSALNKLKRDLRSNVPVPLPRGLLDIAAYRFAYDMDLKHGPQGCSVAGKHDDKFWSNADARNILLRLRFDEHCHLHARSCFKKSCECRFFFPFMAQPEATQVFEDPDKKATLFYTLDGERHERTGFVVELERPQACQFMNAHNISISSILSCNTNVQTGDWAQCFYQTLYTSKVTVKEDSEPRDLVARQVVRRLLRAQDAAREREAAGEEVEQGNDWLEGLSRMLSGINASSSRTVTSAPMSASLVMKHGERFVFSHDFAELLLGQMEAVLLGEDVGFICRKCTGSDGKPSRWADMSANDYLFRPKALELMCLAEQTSKYSKGYKKKQHKSEGDGSDSASDAKDIDLMVEEGHPGHGYAYLKENTHCKIPLMSVPDGHLCQLKDLCLDSEEVVPETDECRERYAQTALLLFHPFRCLENLQTDGSYWRKFNNSRVRHFLIAGERCSHGSGGSRPINTLGACFWEKGFDILQNIEEKVSVSKSSSRTMDKLTFNTNFNQEEDDNSNNKKGDADEDVLDMSFFCDEDSSTSGEPDAGQEKDERAWCYSHTALITQAGATSDRAIEARLSSHDSLIFGEAASDRIGPALAGETSEQASQDRNVGAAQTSWHGLGGFDSVMKLVSGSLLGGESHADVYTHIDYGTGPEDGNSFRNVDIPAHSSGDHATFTARVPTLAGVARMVAREENKVLDEKQYIMYEVIACTFLLDMIYSQDIDGKGALERQLSGALGARMGQDMDELVKVLEERGGRRQLIMFATGLAGSGKSTGITVAQRFCFEFCKAASVMWEDNTFLFTAYTGSAAAAFGGLTTSSATYLSKTKINDSDRQRFEGVRILVIDEVSFLKDFELKRLMEHLQNIGDSHKPFGGYNIIFGGDFQQMKPVNVPDSEILWHPSSSGKFEQVVNCAIILEGIHRFKDNRRYGEMLKRLCSGELTEEDIDWVNTRVLGRDGLKLPKSLEGNACYACHTNKERNAVTAAIFDKHLRATHPHKDSSDLPPTHTLIIEADIQPARGSGEGKNMTSLRRRILELGDNDVKKGTRTLVDPCLRCYMGVYFMCNSNERLKDDGTGNGTQCRLLSVKLKDNPKSYMWKIWNRRKVWTVCASDVQWVEFEHFPKTQEILTLESLLTQKKQVQLSNPTSKGAACAASIEARLRKAVRSRIFKLTPKSFGSCIVQVSPNDCVLEKQAMKCNITQISVNASDAITGHKLQGLTKDQLIVYSWHKSTSWIYVVLSRVRKLEGLFLVKGLRLRDIKPPSRDYLAFMDRMRILEKFDLERSRGRH